MYEELENTGVWCKKIADLVNVFVRKLAKGEVVAPGELMSQV